MPIRQQPAISLHVQSPVQGDDEYRAMFELDGVGKIEADLQTGKFLRVNAKFCELTGYSSQELLTLTLADITHPDDLAATHESRMRMLRGDSREHAAEKRYLRKDGSILWVSINAAPLKNPLGNPLRAIATILDITDRKRAQWRDQDKSEILEMAVKQLPLNDILTKIARAIERQIGDAASAILLLEDGNVRVLSPTLPHQWCDALSANGISLAVHLSSVAWDAPDTCGITFPQRDLAWSAIHPIATSHGIESCWTVPIRSSDDTPLGLITLFFHDARPPAPAEILTIHSIAKLATLCVEHHAATTQLAHLVGHDPLTHLPNRLMLEDRLESALVTSASATTHVALMVIDIDHFKSINDSLGHEAGDHLLQQFAFRLKSKLRKSDTLARIGGDEFVVVLTGVASRENAARVAQKLVDALAEPFDLGGQRITCTASIGIALTPDDGTDHASLQEKADAALYKVKAQSRNGFAFSN